MGGLLDASVDHTIEVRLRTVDGLNNDVIEFWVDGTLVGTGGSFENFYANFTAGFDPANYAVNTILLRAGEAAGNPFAADGAGGNRQGFYIDDVTTSAYDSQRLEFDANDPEYDYLAAGESVDVTVNYDVTDGTSTTTASTVITVTGTNDDPEAEDVTGTADEDGDAITITPVVNDVDVTDTHTILIATQPAEGGVASVNLAGEIVYDPDGDFDYLAEGEMAEVTFTYTADDGNGGIDTGTVTVTVAGANDAPVLTAGVVSGSTSEPVGVTGAGAATPVTGIFSVADADTNGQTEMEVSFGSFSTNYGARQASGLTPGQIDALVASLSVTPLVGNDGTVTWTFAPDNSALDFIRLGEVFTVVLNVNVDDGEGGTATQPITITINGSNDTIFPGTVYELTGGVDESDSGNVTTTGIIQYDDADFTNHVALVTRVGGSSTISGGALTATVTNQALDDGSGQIDWSYSIGAAATDSLAEGETCVEVFQIRIVGTASDELVQEVTVTITGTNDDPVIDAVVGDFTGAVTEETGTTAGEGVLEANGSISFSDVDYLAEGETLTITYTLTVTDSHGGSDTQDFVITITGTNDGPIVMDEADAATEGEGLVTGDASDNDCDADVSDSAAYALDDTAPAGFTLNADGTWSFDPSNAAYDYLSDGEDLELSIAYTRTDGQGATASTSSFTLTFNAAAESANGTPGVDTLVGTALDDNLNGLGGNDTLLGEGGDDAILGGAGLDNLLGGDGDDSLSGEAGNDTLLGGEGDDILNGGANADIMVGGNGNDTYFVDSASDVIIELSGEGVDTVNATTSAYTLGNNVENLNPMSAGNANGYGNGLNNIITGYDANNVLSGGAGDDQLIAGAGADQLYGGAGSDEMIGGSGDDTYYVTDAGDNVVEAAEEGNDLVVSTVSFSLGDHVERLALSGNAAMNGTGNDLSNVTRGNNAVNTLSGGEGDDTLYGNGGKDIMVGGAGRDNFYGGAGADRFVFADGDFGGTTSSTADVIRDFSQAEGDLIDLSMVDAMEGAGDDAFTFIGTAAFTQTAGELCYVTTATFTTIQGDIDGDVVADFWIRVTGNVAIDEGDFVL